ncbi:MAG: T9SS type A sorting domain-containing protein [Bacteroidia bacterium]
MKAIILTSALTLALSTSVIAQNRVVLIEQFTNSGCGSCAAYTPTVYNYLNNNPADVVGIAYHAPYPYNDSMHYDNPVDANARLNFYNIGGVPHSMVDGNYFDNTTSALTPTIATKINTRKVVAPTYEITNPTLTLVGNQLSGVFKFKALSTSTANLVAHIVVIEKDVLKSSYAASPGNNSETHYPYVMRKMFPTASGTVLVNTTANGMDSINLNWTLSRIKNNAQLRVVAFVQNTTTKEVQEAQLFEIPATTTALKNTTAELTNATLYPNPASNTVAITLHNATFINTITITNELGEIVYNEVVNKNTAVVNTNVNLANGLYFVTIANDATQITKKLTIIN